MQLAVARQSCDVTRRVCGGQASVCICGASVLEAPHCDKRHVVTSLLQSRATICGATNTSLEKGFFLNCSFEGIFVVIYTYICLIATNVCFIYGSRNAWKPKECSEIRILFTKLTGMNHPVPPWLQQYLTSKSVFNFLPFLWNVDVSLTNCTVSSQKTVKSNLKIRPLIPCYKSAIQYSVLIQSTQYE
jgi:hypothetical protein